MDRPVLLALVKVAEPALVPNVPLPMLLMSMTVPAGNAPVAGQAMVLLALLAVGKQVSVQLLSGELMRVAWGGGVLGARGKRR